MKNYDNILRGHITALKGKFGVYTSPSAVYSVYVSPEDTFASGDSRKAVIRKIARQARNLGLRANETYWYDPVFYVGGAKDWRRLCALLEYCNGAALQRTARNNYGRYNRPRAGNSAE